MKNLSVVLLASVAFAIAFFASYRFSTAGDGDPPGHVNLHDFGDATCLVTFDLGGSDGIEQTVLMKPRITDVGGKRFVSGVTTNVYNEINVPYPGTVAYVALERISYIQILPPRQKPD
ncbi:hypothetical protein FYK55_26170 [Roseiconus nitratireducens]|uniref:Uncharacterized protein n=1 Tax=Roseiconus nitratireducens TaxID=2605748 RepID=A0A5M6D1E7_9BACT|nr:hypothetical protein [Roseiconus nitratireducens]KAA5538925.1 hypothetical protein FYK55_26170 [Roseiconus nitratireducens]